MITKSSGLKTIARSVVRKNRDSIARQVMKDQKMRAKVLQILARITQKGDVSYVLKEEALSFTWCSS